MEIKQGDRVRVSKDAPWIYTPDWVDAMFDLVLKVTEVEDGNAMVEFAKRTPYRTVLTAIPTKYLVKVDAEAKEAKYHKGEKVCYNGYVYEIEGLVGKNRYALKGLNFDLDEDMIEPYEPYTEPTEQTEAEKKPYEGIPKKLQTK